MCAHSSSYLLTKSHLLVTIYDTRLSFCSRALLPRVSPLMIESLSSRTAAPPAAGPATKLTKNIQTSSFAVIFWPLDSSARQRSPAVMKNPLEVPVISLICLNRACRVPVSETPTCVEPGTPAKLFITCSGPGLTVRGPNIEGAHVATNATKNAPMCVAAENKNRDLKRDLWYLPSTPRHCLPTCRRPRSIHSEMMGIAVENPKTADRPPSAPTVLTLSCQFVVCQSRRMARFKQHT